MPHGSGNPVGAKHQYGPYSALKKAHGCGERKPPLHDAHTVRIRLKHFGYGHIEIVLKQENLFKAVAHHGTYLQYQHDDNGIPYARQGDVPDHLKPVSPVHLGGFIIFRIDGGQRSQKDNGAPARLFPDVRYDDQEPEPLFRTQKVDFGAGHGKDQLIDHAVVHGQEIDHNARNHNPGDKMGQIHHGLGRTFEERGFCFIQQQCQQNGNREVDQQPQKAQGNGVEKDLIKLAAAKQLREMGEVVPRAAQYAFFEGKILKGNNDAVNGHIAEDNQIDQPRQAKEIQVLFLHHIAKKPAKPPRGSGA